ncbi:MAG: ABC transporter ATP-binding protein [Lachnospiraceae bacterium]|nr:ABC transporter ATP-binding protein [Lachnospiraceae bacterium]
MSLKGYKEQLKWIYQYARHYVGAMIFYTLLGFVGIGTGLLSSLVSKDLVDIITGHDTGEVVQTFSIMISMTLLSTAINKASDYVASKINYRVDANIKSDIFEKILVTDWESLTNYHTGDLLVRWSSDVSTISNGILTYVPNLIVYVARFVSALVMVIYYDWTFAVFAIVSMPFSFLISRESMKRMRRNNAKSANINARMSGFNQEAFSNIQTIKAFDLVKEYSKRLRNIQEEFIGMRLSFQRMSMFTSLLMVLLSMVVSYVSYGWGIYRVWSGAITYGTMTMFLTLASTLSSSVNNLINLIPGAVSLSVSTRRLMDIVEMPREDYSEDDAMAQYMRENHDRGIGFVVDNVSYAYMNGTEVFKGACMEARPHRIVGLIGPSGEGKTTMMRMLLALINPSEGSISLVPGGEDLESGDVRKLTASSRKLFSYVPQGNTMFSGTIKDNMLRIKPDATDEEIIEALKSACAWGFVSKLPDGIDSVIKERGGGFSEGQAQRLSIARALLRKSPILLLDEATSALDETTQKELLKNITQDRYPRTCVVTTHRLSLLKVCDSVYEIRDKKCNLLKEENIREILRNIMD